MFIILIIIISIYEPHSSWMQWDMYTKSSWEWMGSHLQKQWVLTPLRQWAEINARICLWENMCGMVRKVLLRLRDTEELMQIGCDNDWPEKKSRGDIRMHQHFCVYVRF